MFLKSLDIFGFKSFADRTHIDFADGITALLGPNGCGKSNVVDAIKWVLAEGRSKNLRADSMVDIIFSGTEKRPAMNVAEVTLTIMNENSLLPLDEPEIAIKRRIFRSGENEYFINGRQTNQKQIRSLFMDTGIGKAAYSVMEQGKIDQILSSKPEDRRYLFEEAAGISRSKSECAEAERELERTRINMQQIEVALSEIKRSYESLKTQSAKTTEYRKIKESVFQYELDIQLLRLKNFVTEKARAENDSKDVEKKRDAVRKEIEEINNTLLENTDRLNELQNQKHAKEGDLIGIGKEEIGKKEVIKRISSQSDETKEKINLLLVREKSIKEQIDSLNEEIDDSAAALHDKQKQLNDIKQNISSFEGNITAASNQITENGRRILEGKNHIAELDADRSELRKQLASITEDIVAMLDTKLRDAGFSENALAAAKEKIDNIVSRIKIFTDGRKNIFNDFAQSGSHTNEDCIRTIKDAATAFDETTALVTELEDALSAYNKMTPVFISELLAPEGTMTKKRSIDQKISENLERVAAINKNNEELDSTNKNLEIKINEYRETLSKLRVNQAKMQEQITAAEQQAGMLRRSLAEKNSTLHQNEEELDAENSKAKNLTEQLEIANEELAEIQKRGVTLANELKQLDAEIIKGNSHVSGKQNQLNKKNEEQNKYQAQLERLSTLINQNEIEIKNVKQNFQETHSRDLMEFEERMYKITKSSADLREEKAKASESLKALGHVNLMAPEEFVEVKERYERQKANFEDTQKSLENLVRVSEEIKSKSSEMFLDTYNKIKRNFHNMFRRLFNGGRAELRLQDPQNVLTSGIDIFAQPPGKKMENIALLSGGEKTMTAVALLFATYQVRPSPFCLLDEIDAALDDKNVSSFVTTLKSFANVSQYIVITHNKKTVMGATTMLGVTMEESGISKTIALRLDQDIKVGADIHDEEVEFEEEDVEPEKDVYIPPRPPKRVHD